MTRLDMYVLLVFNIISYIGKNAFELSYLKNKKALQFKESFQNVKTNTQNCKSAVFIYYSSIIQTQQSGRQIHES